MHLSPTNRVSRDALSATVKLAEEIGESTAEFFSLRCWEQCLELPSSLCCILRRRASSMILVSNGVGVGWSYGNALVGEFMFTFSRVFHRVPDGSELRFRFFGDVCRATFSTLSASRCEG